MKVSSAHMTEIIPHSRSHNNKLVNVKVKRKFLPPSQVFARTQLTTFKLLLVDKYEVAKILYVLHHVHKCKTSREHARRFESFIAYTISRESF